MNYKEYQNLVQSEYQNILKENVLFWNLWNITYPFEILANIKMIILKNIKFSMKCGSAVGK